MGSSTHSQQGGEVEERRDRVVYSEINDFISEQKKQAGSGAIQ